MDLKDLHPTGILENPREGFPSLLENFFVRTFYEPKVKDEIGWKGIVPRLARYRSWTAKIAGKEGIYCISFRYPEVKKKWVHGVFYLQYFPCMDEKVFDSFSVQENILRAEEKFEDWIRHAPGDSDPLDQTFIIGKMVLSVDSRGKTLFVTLWSPQRWIEIYRGGLRFERDDGTFLEIIGPGERNRNLRAFNLSWPFFNKIILSIAHQFQEGPFLAAMMVRDGPVWEVSNNFKWKPRRGERTKEFFVYAGFGKSIPWVEIPRVEMISEFWSGKRSKLLWLISPPSVKPVGITRRWWEIGAPYVEKREVPYRPPMMIITGFLGSGKTTLLNHIAEHKTLMAYRFVAVIQNEVGTVGVDEFLTDSAFTITSIDEGCVCCTLKRNLYDTICRLCVDYEPNLVILETTGLADPANILRDIAEVEKFVCLDTVVTVVDAANFKKNFQLIPVMASQIQWADVVVVNKADLVDECELNEVIAEVRNINGRAPVFPTSYGNFPPGLLYSLAKDTLKVFREDQEMISEKVDTHLNSMGISSITIFMDGCFQMDKLCHVLDNLPPSVYRLKGVVSIEGFDDQQLLQFVFGRYEFMNFHDAHIKPNTIVVIGEKLYREELEGLFHSCLISGYTDSSRGLI